MLIYSIFSCDPAASMVPPVTYLLTNPYFKKIFLKSSSSSGKQYTGITTQTEMGDTIGIGIAHRYFGLRYQVSVSVSLDLKHRY